MTGEKADYIEILNEIKSGYIANCNNCDDYYDCYDCGDCDDCNVKSACFDFSAIQTIDIVIEVLKQKPKRGKWVGTAEYCKHLEEETGERYQPSGIGSTLYCDQCWSGTIKKFDFCPNCGADMRNNEE